VGVELAAEFLAQLVVNLLFCVQGEVDLRAPIVAREPYIQQPDTFSLLKAGEDRVQVIDAS
jgi:hypothetical protein